MGQLAEAPRDPPITAEKAGTFNLYRSKETVSSIEYLNLNNDGKSKFIGCIFVKILKCALQQELLPYFAAYKVNHP